MKPTKKRISKSKFQSMNEELNSTNYTAPKYISTFLNNVNSYAHSTRKETVGDLATIVFPDYVSQATSPSPSDWEEYYLTHHQDKYDEALKKLLEKFNDVKKAVNAVNKDDIKAWLDDLLFYKTYNGLYVQDAILKHIADEMKTTYQPSSSEDEGKGIDGYINGIPYSVKSETYKDSSAHNIETIQAKMVYYNYIYKEGSNTHVDCVEYYIEENENQ